MKKLAAFLCLTLAVLLFSGVTPAWVDETSREFDGKWIGEGPGDLCYGVSKINFTVKNGVLEGTWYRGVARANATTVNFNAKINRSNKISGYIGENIHLFKIDGRFNGEIASGTINSGRSPGVCSSFWTAKRIEGRARKESDLTSNDNSLTTEVETRTSSDDDPLEAKLEKLKKLLEKGLITEEEAAAKRAKLLARIIHAWRPI